MSNSKKTIRLLTIATVLLPLMIVILVIYPVYNHYFYIQEDIDNETIILLKKTPGRHVLEELSNKRIMLRPRKDKSEAIRIANSVLKGDLYISGNNPLHIDPSFSPGDLDIGSPGIKLDIASLIVPAILLDAYHYTNDKKYFDAASKYIFAWSKFENNSIFPTGYIWDDHAISARIHVYVMFWKYYRNHKNYEIEKVKELLKTVYLSTRMLASPEHFTYSTNHGVMQNLALWKAAIAFPFLPDREHFVKVAHNRLIEQLTFYVSDEGVVLEHSAGYQSYGVELLSLMFEYMQYLGIKPEHSLITKYEKVKKVYGNLIRPDNTLPMYGDTKHNAKESLYISKYRERTNDMGPLLKHGNWNDRLPVSVYKNSGLAVWWERINTANDDINKAQTTISWANFDSKAHKHADELSLLFWARGQSWWTNVGYWPYGHELRSSAVSWAGSNAPHCAEENFATRRKSSLISRHSGENINLLDLKRRSETGCVVRRQVMQLSMPRYKSPVWIVLDNPGDKKPIQHIWTVPSNVKIQPHGKGFLLNTLNTDSNVAVAFSGSAGSGSQILNGSVSPFSGWVSMNESVEQTDSLYINVPENGWSALAWTISDDESKKIQLDMKEWSAADRWMFNLIFDDGHYLSIKREAEKITLSDSDLSGKSESVNLTSYPNSEHDNKYNIAYQQVAKKYPKYIDYYYYRIKLIKFILLVLILQEVFFLILRRVTGKVVFQQTIRVASLVCWIGLGYWQYFYYFST